MRNRWGVEIKKGHWVSGRTSRGDAVQGRVAKIERTGDYARAYGPRVILDTGESLGVDDIAQTLGPMTVEDDGTVRQNPALYKSVELITNGGTEFGVDSVTPVRFEFTSLSRVRKSSPNGRIWQSYKLPSEIVQSADFQAWARENGGTVFMSLRELRAKLKEFYNPVNSNPLTRVRIKSPPQRPAGNSSAPSKRLMTRRKKTAKAAPGVYANPVVKPIRNRKAAPTHYAPDTMRTWNDHYIVQRSPNPDAKAWDSIGVFPKRVDAENFARNYARQHSTQYVRVVTPD